MTTNTIEPQVEYVEDGSTLVHPIPFKFLAASDLVVQRISSAGVTTLALGTDYSADGAGGDDGGSLIKVSAGTSGDVVRIRRRTARSQEFDYATGDTFPAESHEAALDRQSLVNQEQDVEIEDLGDRALLVPDGETATELPAASARANKFLAFDALGGTTAASGTGTDSSLRDDLGNVSGTGAQLVSWIQAGVSAVTRLVRDKLRDSVSVEDFGATGDGSTDDRAAIQAAIDFVSGTLGGGDVRFATGATYRAVITTSVTDKGLVVKDGVRLVGDATISLECTGSVYGVRLKNNAGVKRLTINTAVSATPGSQGIWHAPISIGPAYGEGGTVGAVSSFEGLSGWSIEDVTLSNARTGGGGYLIQGHGGINNGRIDGVYAPDSATSSGIVMLDWAFVGTISSGDIPTSRTNFDAGTAYTTHPHNIDIRNIRGGNLSNSNSHGVRLAGCYGIRVDGVDIAATNYAGVYHHAGDVGFEFAPASVKPSRFIPNVFRNVAIKDANNGWGVFADNYADNIAAAVSGSGYSPLLDPIQRKDLVLENITVASDAGASVQSGFRIQQILGVQLINPKAIGFSNGILIEEDASDVLIRNPFVTGNRRAGIYTGHPSRAGDRVTIEGGEIFDNSKDAGAGNQASIFVESQPNVTIRGVAIGRAGVSEGAIWGVRSDSAATLLTVEDCHVETLKSGGVGYSFGSSGDVGIVKSFKNNTVGAGVSNGWGGVTIQVTESRVDTDGVTRRTMRAARASLASDTTPNAGTFVKGDIIFYNDPDAGGRVGTVCTTGGSPGTWKKFGTVDA